MASRVTFLVLFIACLVGAALAKKCYQCTTIDPDCANDRVKASRFLVPCPGSAQSCRTIAQNVEGDKRIVRQCSNVTGAEDMSCQERIGTNKIKVTYCHCRTDGCNSAGHLTASVGLALGLAFLVQLLA